MINSILERKRKRITLDRLLIVNSNDSSQTLITDPEDINKFANSHFQNVARGAQPRQTLSFRWANQYVLKENIDINWYNSIMDPPPIEEWFNISGISNEMIKQVGPLM